MVYRPELVSVLLLLFIFSFFFFLRRYRIETANNSNHGEPSGIMEYIFCCVDNCWNQYIMQGVMITIIGSFYPIPP